MPSCLMYRKLFAKFLNEGPGGNNLEVFNELHRFHVIVT